MPLSNPERWYVRTERTNNTLSAVPLVVFNIRGKLKFHSFWLYHENVETDAKNFTVLIECVAYPNVDNAWESVSTVVANATVNFAVGYPNLLGEDILSLVNFPALFLNENESLDCIDLRITVTLDSVPGTFPEYWVGLIWSVPR